MNKGTNRKLRATNGKGPVSTEQGPESIEGVLERVSQSNPEAVEAISQYIEVHKSHHGPMPCPEDLKQYSIIHKDLPDRMMVMAEKSQNEKTSQNEQILSLKGKEIEVLKLEVEQAESAHIREISVQKTSLYFAFIIVLLCISGSFYMATIDQAAVAIIIGGTTVVGIVGAFLNSKIKKENK